MLMRQSTELGDVHVFVSEGSPRIPGSLPAFCSHLEIWTLFPRTPCIWQVCVSPRWLLEEFHDFLCEDEPGSCSSCSAWFNSGYTLLCQSTVSLAGVGRVGIFRRNAAFFGLRPSEGGGDAGTLPPKCSVTEIWCIHNGLWRNTRHEYRVRTTTTTTTTATTKRAPFCVTCLHGHFRTARDRS